MIHYNASLDSTRNVHIDVAYVKDPDARLYLLTE